MSSRPKPHQSTHVSPIEIGEGVKAFLTSDPADLGIPLTGVDAYDIEQRESPLFVTPEEMRAEAGDHGTLFDQTDDVYSGFTAGYESEPTTPGIGYPNCLPPERMCWENFGAEDRSSGVHNGW